MIKIEFEKQYTDGNIFRDAIVLTEEEYAMLTPTDIEDIKLSRFNSWVDTITTV